MHQVLNFQLKSSDEIQACATDQVFLSVSVLAETDHFCHQTRPLLNMKAICNVRTQLGRSSRKWSGLLCFVFYNQMVNCMKSFIKISWTKEKKQKHQFEYWKTNTLRWDNRVHMSIWSEILMLKIIHQMSSISFGLMSRTEFLSADRQTSQFGHPLFIDTPPKKSKRGIGHFSFCSQHMIL